MTDKIIYCRREITQDDNGSKPCGLFIEEVNALQWCNECRKRLPFWPEEELYDAKVEARMDLIESEGE